MCDRTDPPLPKYPTNKVREWDFPVEGYHPYKRMQSQVPIQAFRENRIGWGMVAPEALPPEVLRLITAEFHVFSVEPGWPPDQAVKWTGFSMHFLPLAPGSPPPRYRLEITRDPDGKLSLSATLVEEKLAKLHVKRWLHVKRFVAIEGRS